MVKVIFQLQVLLLSLLIIVSSVSVDSAHAQDAQGDGGSPKHVFELETMTVTSEKREKDVQTIPSSVTVVGETQIEDFELKSTFDLVSLTPNLYFVNVGHGMQKSIISLRGVNSNSLGGSALGIYVDDVSYSGLEISLYDIERIEVLRGPQGTLYGRNSESGIINIVTRKPSSEWEGNVSLEGGSFYTTELKASFSGPILGDRFGFKAAMRYFESDGYFENKYDNSDDAGSEENLDGRLTFTAAPTEKLDLTLTADLQNYESPKYANFAPLDAEDMRKAINVDYAGGTSKDADGASLRIEYQLEGMKLVSITSTHKEDYFYTQDIDFIPIDLMTMETETDVTSNAQELRLISDRPESSLQWLAGLFLLNEENDNDYSMWMNFMNMGYGVPGETVYWKSNTDTLDAALFGEATYSFAVGLDLTLGLRYDREQVDFDYRQQPSGSMLETMGYSAYATSNDETFDAWLPKVALSYHLSEEMIPYFIVSRGFRSGGFNENSQVGTPYDPEFTWNYELGAKTSWWDNRLRLNAALFYIDRTDMQVEIITSDGYSMYIDNAAKASSKGFEAELTARPVGGLELVAGAAYTDSKYDEYTSGTDVFDGNHTIQSPEYTLNLGATYRHSSGFFLSTRYNHIGEIYFDTANTESQGDYGLFGAKIGYEAEHFDIYLYGENLFDEEYVTRAFEVSEVWYGRAGAPQNFGVTIQGRF
jgi:iron complex outermembrane receptor protein